MKKYLLLIVFAMGTFANFAQEKDDVVTTYYLIRHAEKNRAVEGDITGVTMNLGVAFNSTFIALGISIVLMFFIHQLQLMQERLVLDTESWCDENLISRLQTRPLP